MFHFINNICETMSSTFFYRTPTFDLSSIINSEFDEINSSDLCTLCPKCEDLPDTLSTQPYELYCYEWSIKLNCNKCNSFWFLCKHCPSEHQIMNKLKYRKNQSNKRIHEIYAQYMKDHNSLFHINSILIQNDNISSNDYHSNASDIDISTNEVQNSIDQSLYDTIEVALSNIFSKTEIDYKPYSQLIHEMETQEESSYAKFMIKKYWNKNMYNDISDIDVNLFLRICQKFMKSSRTESEELIEILNLNEQRTNQQIAQYKHHIKLLEDTIIQQNEKLNQTNTCINNQFDIPNFYEHNYIKLPSEIKHIKQIKDYDTSFTKKFIVPPVHNFNSGFAYVLPSIVIPMSIANGLEF